MTEQLYFDDPLHLEFDAEVTEVFPLPGGSFGAVLPRTYFCPTGGGQDHDIGTLGEANVIGVEKDDDGRIVHGLDRELAPGTHPARIDRDRRLRTMQHHTGQHLLSAACLRLLEVESVSANINTYNPATVDLAVPDLPAADLQRVEQAANEIIFEDRPVKSYFITDADVPNIPFRKPPKVSGCIRVIEIDGYDYTPCGGTHCLRTGMIGVLKIVRTERVNQKLRLHFVAGLQALDVFRACQEVAGQAAVLLNTKPDEIPAVLGELVEESGRMRAELESLRRERLEFEAQGLAGQAESVGAVKLVMGIFPGRAPSDLRALGARLASFPGVVAVLGTHEQGKLSLVVASATGTGVDARALLKRHLDPLGGKGGGDATLAQGGGPVDAANLAAIFQHTRAWISGG